MPTYKRRTRASTRVVTDFEAKLHDRLPQPKIVKGYSPAECRQGFFHQRKGCGMVSRPLVHPPYPHIVSQVIFEPDYGNLPGVPLVEALYGQGLKSVLFEGNPPPPGSMHFELYWPGLDEDLGHPEILPGVYDPADTSLWVRLLYWIALLYQEFFEGEGKTGETRNSRFRIQNAQWPRGYNFEDIRLVNIYSLDGVSWWPHLGLAMK